MNPTFFEDIDDSISPLLVVDRTDGIVDLGEGNSRDVAVCCAFDGLDVRFDGIAARFVTEIGDEWFGVEADRFGNSSPVGYISASSSPA